MKLKRNYFPLIILCFALLLASCKKDDSQDEPVSADAIAASQLDAGESANDILSNDNFTKMKIEIAYVVGFRPTDEAMVEFVNFLKTYTLKEDIELIYTELQSPELETLTLNEIAELEAENRTVYNSGETLGVYMYFTDAPADDDIEEENIITLGAVYRNTTMVVYGPSINQIGSVNFLISVADVEIATINHEFGHLFGLVNLGSPQVNNHQDSEAANHCNVAGCLMRAQLQFDLSNSKTIAFSAKNELKSTCSISGSSILNMLETRTSKGLSVSIPLDSECILDLKANGGR